MRLLALTILALTAALLGWMFDGMEMGLFPLVGNDALKELATSNANMWFGVITAMFGMQRR